MNVIKAIMLLYKIMAIQFANYVLKIVFIAMKINVLIV